MVRSDEFAERRRGALCVSMFRKTQSENVDRVVSGAQRRLPRSNDNAVG